MRSRPSPVLVCDEITSALDVSVQAAIVELLSELQREMGLGLLFVTHNLALVRTIAQDVAVMSEGGSSSSARSTTCSRAPQEPTRAALLADTPSLDGAPEAPGLTAPPVRFARLNEGDT